MKEINLRQYDERKFEYQLKEVLMLGLTPLQRDSYPQN